jgi:adenylate cyclase
MTPDQVKRKLAAIVSADVKGYSRLMEEDEEGTIRTLKAYMEAINGLIQQHRGRLVATGGDSVLAEFSSVVDAVRCAVGIQEELKDRNRELPEERTMEFRIGVNLGDVVEEGDTILGDGVNIAARVQSLAEAGGICITGTAYDQIKKKLVLGYEFIGEQTVKNIKESVKVYRVVMEPGIKVSETTPSEGPVEKKPVRKRLSRAVLGGIALLVIAGAAALYQFALAPSDPKSEVASKKKMAFPLPDVPSIAVLPFMNMSGDPELEHFSDGITEEIITALSKTPKLLVIARNSTFTYKGKPVRVNQVAEDLGVRYVLEGSVRKAKDRLRITAQLIDALTGHHLWAERYDREPKDIFVLQDEITLKILNSLHVKLTGGEQDRVYVKGTNNLEAYIKVLQGRDYFWRLNREGNILAKKMFEEAITLDPKFPSPYWLLGMTHVMDTWFDWGKSKEDSLSRAIELANMTISLNDLDSNAHGLLSAAYRLKGDHDKAIAEGKRAVELDPNSADAHVWLGIALNYSDRAEEAIPLFEKAIRLNPYAHTWYFLHLGNSYRILGRYDEAIATYQKAIQLSPKNLIAHLGLTYTYSLSGRNKEASVHATEILRISPDFSLDRFAEKIPFKNKDEKELYINTMRKAGMK